MSRSRFRSAMTAASSSLVRDRPCPESLVRMISSVVSWRAAAAVELCRIWLSDERRDGRSRPARSCSMRFGCGILCAEMGCTAVTSRDGSSRSSTSGKSIVPAREDNGRIDRCAGRDVMPTCQSSLLDVERCMPRGRDVDTGRLVRGSGDTASGTSATSSAGDDGNTIELRRLVRRDSTARPPVLGGPSMSSSKPRSTAFKVDRLPPASRPISCRGICELDPATGSSMSTTLIVRPRRFFKMADCRAAAACCRWSSVLVNDDEGSTTPVCDNERKARACP